MHDFEPGIKPSGLFWTIPIDRSAIALDPVTGRARFHMQNLAVPDYHDFFSAISPSPESVPGLVSFDVRWAGGGDRTNVRDVAFDFAGEYVTGATTIDFVVSSNGGPAISSDANGQTNVGSPGVGHERNGVFFNR